MMNPTRALARRCPSTPGAGRRIRGNGPNGYNGCSRRYQGSFRDISDTSRYRRISSSSGRARRNARS
jgi:hypothetical protein